MTTFVFTVMVLSGILFIISVLLMSPKWGLWFGIWGMSTSNEYSSKKSVESTLKKSAFFSIIIFSISAMLYPYLTKKQLSTQQTTKNQTLIPNINVWTGIQLKQQDIKRAKKKEDKWIDEKWQNLEINAKWDDNNISTWTTKK